MLRPAILKQSTESLDAIAQEIDAAKDLLSLSLTCKALYAIVFYRHLRFRIISCQLDDWRSLEIWNLLAQDKALARSVRVLELQPLGTADRQILIPLDAKDSKTQENSARNVRSTSELSEYELYAQALAHLVPALENLSRLTSFTWKTHTIRGPMLDVFRHDPKHAMGLVWSALNKCRYVHSLHIEHDWYQGTSFFEVNNLAQGFEIG